MWKHGALIITLKGHNAAVWSVLPLANGILLSGSADKTIRIWRGEVCVNTIETKSMVRCLAPYKDNGWVCGDSEGHVTEYNAKGQPVGKVKASDKGSAVYGVLMASEQGCADTTLHAEPQP